MIARPTNRPDAIPDHLLIEVMRVDDSASPNLPELRQWLGDTESREILKPHLLRRVWNLAEQLVKGLDAAKSRALVFARTRRDTARYAEVLRRYLKHQGKTLAVECFHAGQSPDERIDLYERFQQGGIQVLVATKAFGMGMDIPNIHFLAHLDLPATLEDYLQEIGRAGRDRRLLAAAGFSADTPIRCLLYYSQIEIKSSRSFLRRNRLNWPDLQFVLAALMDYSRKLHGSPQPRPMIVPLEAATLMPLGRLDDTGLRMALHWLEQLGRITLGNFFPPQLEFRLGEALPDAGPEPWMAVARDLRSRAKGTDVIQLPMGNLQTLMPQIKPEDLFRQLQQGVKRGLFTLENSVCLQLDKEGPQDEWAWCVREDRLPYSLSARIGLAQKLARELKHKDLELTRDELVERVRMHVEGGIHEEQHGWLTGMRRKDLEPRIEDWTRRQVRTLCLQTGPLLRILRQNRAVRTESVIDGARGITIRLSLQAGGLEHNLPRLETHCLRLLALAQSYGHSAKRLTDLLDEMGCSLEELQNAASLLCACGILKSETLLGRAIRVDVHSFQRLDDPLPGDDAVRQDFNTHRRLGELRLASLDLAAHLDPVSQRKFFRRFFACKSVADLLECLEGFLKDEELVRRWREEGHEGEIESLLRAVSGELLEQELKEMAPDQRAAIENDPNRSLILEAGPGSGKTRVLVMRCAWLLLKESVPPEDLLVLAYNRAVASELRLRLRRLFEELGIRGEAERVPIHTLHGFAARVLEGRTRFLPLDEWTCLKQELTRVRACPASQLEKAKEIRREDPDTPGTRIAGVQPPLECWIPWATHRLKTRADLVYGRHILLDEMQDLTRDRLELLRVLLERQDVTLFAVGDPDQSIYDYERRKAGDAIDPRTLVEELAGTSGRGIPTERKRLVMNHRSTAAIVAEATLRLDPSGTRTRQHTNRKGREVTVIPADGSGVRGVVLAVYNAIRVWAAKQEKATHSGKQTTDRDAEYRLALLFRTNAEVAGAESELHRDLDLQNLRKIEPGVSIVSDRFLEQYQHSREWHETRSAVAALPEVVDRDTLEAALLAASRRAEAELKCWNRHALKTGRFLVRNLATSRGIPFLRDELLEELDEVVMEGSTIQRVIATGRDLIRNRGSRNTDGREATKPRMRITLGTIHRAKGLEFDQVLVAPSRLELAMDPEILAEERRLLYVACTRARSALTLIEGPREVALKQGKAYHDGKGLAPVPTDLKDLYLNAMVTRGRFRDEAELLENQRLIHHALHDDQELLLVGKTLHVIDSGLPGEAVGMLSKEFASRVESYRKDNNLEEHIPLPGLRVGAVIRRELEEDSLEFHPHPSIIEQGFFWLVVPQGVLQKPEDGH